MAAKLRLTLFIKMIIGFLTSFIIAYLFSLPYSFTAGVIAVLNLWYSRDTVIKTALLRFSAGVIGIIVSTLVFIAIGHSIYHVVVAIVAVLIVLYLVGFEYGATIALVLIGQNFESYAFVQSLNAFYILLIGTIPALLLNLFVLRTPAFLKMDQEQLDEEIQAIFRALAAGAEYDAAKLVALQSKAQANIKVAFENYTVKNFGAQVAYILMRETQLNILQEIIPLYTSEKDSPHKQKINTFLKAFEHQIGFANYAEPLLVKLDELHHYFDEQQLPKTRSEFEHRALLYVFINKLTLFLQVKVDFHTKYPDFTTFM